MSTNVRLLPPIAIAQQTVVAYGRSYTAAPGATLDVNAGDAQILRANGWTEVAMVGATTARPVPASKGAHYFDTTLGVTVTFDGSKWRDPATADRVSRGRSETVPKRSRTI